jgi:segregation and condensation protein B
MSLKAKIEAVIYASEEPVTLAQLAGLLGHEAQGELDRIDSAQQSLALNEDGENPDGVDRELADQDVLNHEVLSDDPHSGDQLGAEPGSREGLEIAPEVETEAGEAERLEEHLQRAAAEEGAHTKALREHAAADEAAMNTADSLDASLEKTPAGGTEVVVQGEVSAEGFNTERKDGEKKLAREVKEKERRLREYFRRILDQLIADYATSDRGLEIREVAGGYRLATKPEYHDAVRGFVKSLKPPLKLTLQALETLAVVAYKQPVTAPEVSEIRGVDSGGVLGSLMARKLVATAGRKQVIGRPILYKTTKDFLLRFGLKDINELPSIEEFEKMAGELAEQEEIPMEPIGHHALEAPEEVEREKDETEPQADGDGSSVAETVADEAIVDGRISGLPPNYDTDNAGDGADSPALDAEIQSEQRGESEEGR